MLAGSPDIVAYECVCRKARANPCVPSQVCMVVGRPFTDFVLEHHPRTSRRLSRDEALALLQQEHERGHLHSAWFKDVMLDRFYAICTCCCGLKGMVKYGMGNIASSGYVVAVEASICDGCGKCRASCPFGAITTEGVSKIQWEKCMGCGVCEGHAPAGDYACSR